MTGATTTGGTTTGDAAGGSMTGGATTGDAAGRQVKEQAVRLLARMQEKLDAAGRRHTAPVAVIGLGCRFPGGDGPEAFWETLAGGRDAVRPVPPERWEAGAGAQGGGPQAAGSQGGGTAKGGFLDGIDLFDAGFFGISPREADAMDPQQRLALEVAWEALADAGLAPDALDGAAGGVFLGCCTADYARLGDAETMAADGYAATGGAPGVAAGRIAYLLGLTGPALVVDTACSSSLVALHLAVQALRAGECSLALAGGVNLTLLPWGAATLDRLHMLAPDGRCKAFDAAADGFVRGEGCGIVVLRRLDDAVAAGDRVLAVLRGSAVNQDGRSAGLTAPNGPAQEAVIRAALANAGLGAGAVDYVEAHGTGTALGDPIEMHALGAVFGGRERVLRVGSVKTNIGHGEAAAGIAGVIKAVLMLRRQAVPASLHFSRLNPHIALGGAPIDVPTAFAPARLDCIGVSSFGFSGTNAHVVLQAAPPGGGRPALPRPVFARGRHWLDEAERLPGRVLRQASAAAVFEAVILPGAPLVAQHVVRGVPLLPAADMLERLRAAAVATGRGAALTGVVFDRPLAVATPRTVQVVAQAAGPPGEVAGAGMAGDGSLGLFARDGEVWHRHAAASPAEADPAGLADIAALRAACPQELDPAAFDAWLRGAGLEYGPSYACIAQLWCGTGEALARLHPAPFVMLLDAALRTAGAIAAGGGGTVAAAGGGTARLPASVARYQRGGEPGGELWAHARSEAAGGVTVAQVRLLGGDGAELARIDGLRLASAASADPWRDWCHVLEWVEAASPEAAIAAALAELPELAPLEAALEAAAARHARAALADVAEAEVVPRHRRLWRHLGRLAGGGAAEPEVALPPGPEAALLARCGAALPDVLRGRQDPAALLFTDAAAAAVYRDAPVYRAANAIMGVLAAAAVPPAGPVRVLEIGAGTGGTTQAVLARLDARRCEYWFTDVARALVEQARGVVPARHFALFDVEHPPGGQDIPEAAFDLVIAANVLHATRDIGAALGHAVRTLAPGGRLLLLETAPRGGPAGSGPAASWIDLVFGLTEGWWRFADTARRPDYPLLTRAGWMALLAEHGLEAELLPADPAALPGHTILLARRREAACVVRDPGGPAAARCAALLAAIQGLRPEQRRLVLLTRGAQGPAVSDPEAAALWGMMRSLRQERPELELCCIDGDPDGVGLLTAEPELVVHEGRRFVVRLAAAPEAGPDPALDGGIDPAGWVLVTGAFGGLGRVAVDWLRRRGARRLVLTGRSVADAGWVDALRAGGAEIRAVACDLADPQALEALIAGLPVLRGIVHAAGTLDDATLAQARAGQFAAVLAPKLAAARRLDEAFPELDFFLLFGSAVGLFGQPGQAAHAAASTALDALAAARRLRGGRATCIGWGLWRDVGSAAGRTALIARMAESGLGTIPSAAGVAMLDRALAAPVPAFAVLPIDRARFLASFAGGRPPAALRDWQAGATVSASANASVSGPAGAPAGAGDADALVVLVAAEAAAVLGYRPGQAIDRAANLFELGLDSLMAVELRNRLQARLGRALSATLLFEHSSVGSLAAHLAGEAPAAAVPRGHAAGHAPVAIIGLGCRFPAGGDDPAAFWQALAEGRDGVVPPPDRTGMPAGMPAAGYLADVAGFDPGFFGIAPREAVFMDPQHRLLLEVAWEALEDALVAPDRLAGSATGVFVGMCNYDYAAIATAAEGADGYAGTGGAPSIAAGRIAYLLGLTGPAMVVDTACSSSLLAVHLAVASLRRGECSLALAGGVNLALGAGTTTALERLNMLSPGSRCRAFDAAADGFVRGEGCGVVVLKRLADAEADGDRILAVLAGSAANQDGRSSGLTAPSGAAQAAVIRAALADAGMAAEAVDAIEAHGTGTALGDPIEMHALREVFGGRSRVLHVGSVKTNIGHAEAAAGVAGLIKAVLMLERQAVPASLHFRRLNPHIALDGLAAEVPQALATVRLGCVGVSSFGFSGTNVHAVVLAPPPAAPPPAAPVGAARLLVSARTPEALRDLVGRYRAVLAAGARFEDVCASAAAGRARLPWWVCVDSAAGLDPAEPSDAPPPELPPQHGARVALPLTPFRRQAYWAGPARIRAAMPAGAHPLLGRRLRAGVAARVHEVVLAPGPRWLADHGVGGRVVVPAAALVEMMLAAVAGAAPVELAGLRFERMLVPAETPVVQTIVEVAAATEAGAGAGDIRIVAAAEDEDAAFTVIATATVRPAGGPVVPAWAPAWAPALAPALAAMRAECSRPVDPALLYERFAAAGLNYGPAFQGLRALWAGDAAALAELAPPEPGFRLDPRVLDAAWQALAAALPAGSSAALMPRGVGRLVWLGGVARFAAVRLVAPERADVTLYDASGEVVAVCEGLLLAASGQATSGRAPVDAVLHETVWEPVAGGIAATAATAPEMDSAGWLDCRGETDSVAACWRVLEAARTAQGRLAVLARGATEAGGAVPVAAQAALAGLVATLALERPDLRPVLLDVAGGADGGGAPAGPLDSTGRPGPLDGADALDRAGASDRANAPDIMALPPVPAGMGPLLARRDGALLAPVRRDLPFPPAPVAPFVLARAAAATLDGLGWAALARRAPGPGEVEIEVGAAGINFRDVMNLLGVYPGDAGAPGVECTGLVAALGEQVDGLAVGDAVLAIAPGCFASHVVADARLVCRLPVALDAGVAAGQAVARLTARLALEQVAGEQAGGEQPGGLRAGQRVLVHAASGGVGLAAVALVQAAGAVVVATAGSAAKRAHLAALGVAEIYDSRSLGFAAAAPVDVVLNSLTGPAIPAGLRLLRPGGVFVELGKAELWTPAQVAAVRADVRYVAVALDALILAAPARVGAMLRREVAALAGGAACLPVRRFPFAAATEAFRMIQGARHIGRLVLARPLLRGDAAYVVTGGTGALGRAVARWLVGRGARHVVLLARRRAEVAIEGAEVVVLAADVTDEAAVRAALDGLGRPVKGVFHLAGTLHDAVAANLTRAQVAAAFAAKLRGAEVLDRVTAAHPVEQFVLFGSLAGSAGSAGQANYAAANAALAAVAAGRRARGAPALLVEWGAWQDAGMARGRAGLSAEAALAGLAAALAAGLGQVAISAGEAPAVVAVAPLAGLLGAAVGSQKLAVLARAVDEAVSRILGLNGLALERERPLNELGLDSLMAVELRNALGAALGRVLPTTLVFDHPTAAALSLFLAGELGLVGGPAALPAPVASAPVASAPVASVLAGPATADDDDDAMLMLLERKLSHAGY